MSDALPDALLDPAAWPWRVDRVELVGTHISWVLVAGDRVVKLKRPVRYDFVDYSTRELRRRACGDEVRLNRRLSDDIYVGVVPIVRDGERLRIGEEAGGEAVDWATLMRRIDARQMLDRRLGEGRVPDDVAIRLADRLVPFHLQTAPGCTGPIDEVLAIQEGVLRENLAELEPFVGAGLPAFEFGLARMAMDRFLDGHREVMRQRVLEGWIREGHGDLRCEHIVVPDSGPVQVYDCVEFNRDLRCADVASDLAFLLMDLVRLRAPAEVAEVLLRRYQQAGADLPPQVLKLYWIHRALVRAKVHCLQLDTLDEARRLESLGKVADYLHMATQQALTIRPALIMMTGLSGTGKSTVATAMARALGIPRFASDEVRKELAAGTPAPGDIYTNAWTMRTYGEVFRRGAAAVASGRAAILDGTFLDSQLRREAADLARLAGVPLLLVETVTDPAVVAERLMARAARGDSISDATVEIHRRQKERHETHPPMVPEGALRVMVDTTPEGPPDLDGVLRALVGAGVIEARIDEASPVPG